MMKQIEGTFCGFGGIDLFYRAWLPAGAPRGVLVIVHGMGDHCGRFDRLVGPVRENGFAVYGYDLRGFGRSPGRRGHINDWAEYREDLRAFLRFVSAELPGLPVFLFGYSLGSAIVLDFILRDQQGLRGAILSGTPIEPTGVATPVQIAIARLASKVAPTYAIRMTNDIHGVSRDESVLEALQTDPYNHSWVTARWGTETLTTTGWMRSRAADICLPVLFLHGGDDSFNLVRGVQRYFDEVQYPDKTLKIYPGSRHETHNDLDHAQVAADVITWMADHIVGPGRK